MISLQFAYDTAHLIGATVLMMGFGLLYQRRMAAVIRTYSMQAMALAALSNMSEVDPVMYASACQKLHDSDSDTHDDDIVMSNTPDDTNKSPIND